MSTQRIDGLDGLRGIAVIAVILSHIPVLSMGTSAAFDVNSHWIFKGGFLGVQLFFTLSGYLITSQLLQRFKSSGRVSITEFFVNRATRLLPALFVMLAVYAVVAIMEGSSASSLLPMYRSIVLWIVNWHGAFGWFGFESRLGHLWSLSVEEQFYLAWPFVFVTLARMNPRRTLVVCVALFVMIGLWRMRGYGIGISPLVLISRTDFCLDAIVAGCLVAFLTAHRHPTSDQSQRVGVIGSIIVVTLLAIGTPFAHFMYRGGLTLFAVGSAMVVIAVVSSGFGGLVLGIRPLRVVGRCSYGAYLWHFPIFFVVHDHLNDIDSLWRVVLALVITTVLTTMSWMLVEKPALRLRALILAPSSRSHNS